MYSILDMRKNTGAVEKLRQCTLVNLILVDVCIFCCSDMLVLFHNNKVVPVINTVP